MSKSLVIFDLYNTLIYDDSVEERKQYRIDAIWSSFDKNGYPIRFKDVIEAYDFCTEYMITHQQQYFSIDLFELVHIFAKRLSLTDITHIKKIYDIWAFATMQMPPKLLPDIKQGLEELKSNNKKIALISNTASTPGIALRFFLHENGIYELFDDIVFSDEFGFMKPKRSIFQRVLDRMDTLSSDAVFVGDHELYDKMGATNAGIDYLYMAPEKKFLTVIEEVLTLSKK